jgi:hypothetical protein
MGDHCPKMRKAGQISLRQLSIAVLLPLLTVVVVTTTCWCLITFEKDWHHASNKEDRRTALHLLHHTRSHAGEQSSCAGVLDEHAS